MQGLGLELGRGAGLAAAEQLHLIGAPVGDRRTEAKVGGERRVGHGLVDDLHLGPLVLLDRE